MSKSSFETRTIDITDLELDFENPRFEKQSSNRDALRKMASEQGIKLLRLAEHIGRNGLNLSELIIVTKSPRNKRYTVLEGNRRVAAIKLASDPKLAKSLGLRESLCRRLKVINRKFGGNLLSELPCVVAPSRSKARPWIELRHTGENSGVGIIGWNGVAAARFRGVSPETLFVEMVKESGYLDDTTLDKLEKISITNIKRLIGTPEARRLLGLDIRRGQLSVVDEDNLQDTLARMAIVTSDIAKRHFKVTHLDSKDQRVTYARAVSARDLPKPGKAIPATVITGSKRTTSSKSGPKRGSKVGAERKVLIPSSLKTNITRPRILSIQKELQKLSVHDYPNSCAVLLRVLWDMSVSEYGKVHGLKFKKRVKRQGAHVYVDMGLSERTSEVAKHLMDVEPECRSEIQAVLTLTNTKNTIFSIDNWQQYVHNQHLNPIPSDLKLTWDNIQPFYSRLWA